LISAIVTAPPYAPFLDEVAAHPLVRGLRLNTVMPLKESPAEALARLAKLGQPLWVDLKGRQLRVVGAAIPPFTEVFLSHRIQVQTPVDAWFSDGNERARVAAVDGNRLILEDGPRRLIGPGESVNIPHPSLKIEGTLTESDLAYLAAMKALGLKHVMLSYVESPADAEEVREHLPGAEILLKIENQRGLEYAKTHKASQGHLMAARGDLYVEVVRPHRIVTALREIITADPGAVVASRLFNSLAYGPVPDSADIGDAAFLLALGYQTFMFGDDICFQRESVLAALNLLETLAPLVSPHFPQSSAENGGTEGGP
jgi:pyruvate kinase